ncbi:putative transcriptional regulator [Pedobacter cryoconitis]|uniref:Putative transcriptional regulator n=1 Tax=Pedobacter cryoconitis TaxID=188932 RepID=A0A327SC61_9SPHI|nr:putative transcriptional regulator [Pedobacter cryoconitis]
MDPIEIKDLTKAEEQIMQIVWQIEKGFVKEVMDFLPEPKPAYNTVSTIIRILEVKGFIGHEAFGKAHQYHALVSKEDYKRHATAKLLGGYFENSVESMFSFFVKEEKMDVSDVDEILKMISKLKNKAK